MRAELRLALQIHVFGTGAHARKVYHTAVALGYEVAAFVDEDAESVSPVPDVPCVHLSALRRPERVSVIIVAIGRADVRRRLMDRLAAAGWELPALVHPMASVSPDAQLEPGVFVGAGAVVESGSVVGRGAIVDIGAVVDHDCRIGAFAHLKPGEVLAAGSDVPAMA